jgi:hypothetical protein
LVLSLPFLVAPRQHKATPAIHIWFDPPLEWCLAGVEGKICAGAAHGLGKTAMKRPLLIGLLGAAAVLICWVHVRPAFISERSIRASLLYETPVGTRVEEVRALAEQRGWIAPGAKLDSYLIFPTPSTSMAVSVFAGDLRPDPFPYRTAISATWEFDENHRLYEIIVSRHGFE